MVGAARGGSADADDDCAGAGSPGTAGVADCAAAQNGVMESAAQASVILFTGIPSR